MTPISFTEDRSLQLLIRPHLQNQWYHCYLLMNLNQSVLQNLSVLQWKLEDYLFRIMIWFHYWLTLQWICIELSIQLLEELFCDILKKQHILNRDIDSFPKHLLQDHKLFLNHVNLQRNSSCQAGLKSFY